MSKKIKKILISGGLLLIILIIVSTGVGYFMLQKSLPDYNAEINVEKISNTITIYRDSNAVPFIMASNNYDAAFALGYVHAQERMFQMDMLRRAGTGRLSEVLGEKAFPYDKMFRTIGLYEIVKKHFKQFLPENKKMLYSYSDGVNSFIQSKTSGHSIEFDLLGYAPEKWTPYHSMIVAKLIAWQMNMSWWTDIAFTNLSQKLGIDKVKDILPDYNENMPTIIPDNIRKQKLVSLDFMRTDKKFRDFIGFTGTHIGSNNWVVNSKKSISGHPIIANDPHLAFQSPGTWYLAVINSPDWNTAGFTLPGVPAVVIGKNKDIAWAVTNVMADDADFYIEKLDSSKTKYLYNGNWIDLDSRFDTIYTKDVGMEIIEIKSSHRGPIISSIHPYKNLFPDVDSITANISMQWTALKFSKEFDAILKINRAKNWKEFLNGTKNFSSPGMNFVYADVENNIGYVCAAKLPIRKNNSTSFVFDGTTTDGEWLGYVPFNKMPKIYNPSSNYIASANNKTIKSFNYHISNLWEPSSRFERISELILKKNKHSIEDFKVYQNDVFSKYAEDIVPFILNAFVDADVKDENLEISIDLLKQWDFKMDKFYQTPSIFLVFYQKLMNNIFKDETGELFDEYIFMANIPYRVIPDLLRKNNSEWFDNIETKKIEDRDFIIRKSLADALDYLEKKFGTNIAQWQWGEIHSLTFRHFFSGVSSILDPLFNIGPFPIGGDGTTVNNTEYSFNKPYDVKLGASMRFIFDFADSNVFYFILPTGQSGHIFSDHYSDMTDRWLNGKYIKLHTDLSYWQSHFKDKLILN